MKQPFFTSLDCFSTPMWKGYFPQYLEECIKITDPHIKRAQKRDASLLKKTYKKNSKKNLKDFGTSHHSGPLYQEPALKPFLRFIIQVAGDLLDTCGFDLQGHKAWLNECWVQEFSKHGGGNHVTHLHGNNHVSGFYFLKCSPLTSYPVFNDPRPGAMMSKLPLKNIEDITSGSTQINIKPRAGNLIMFPAYLSHHFPVDWGKTPIRFIHFNIQYLPRGAVKK